MDIEPVGCGSSRRSSQGRAGRSEDERREVRARSRARACEEGREEAKFEPESQEQEEQEEGQKEEEKEKEGRRCRGQRKGQREAPREIITEGTQSLVCRDRVGFPRKSSSTSDTASKKVSSSEKQEEGVEQLIVFGDLEFKPGRRRGGVGWAVCGKQQSQEYLGEVPGDALQPVPVDYEGRATHRSWGRYGEGLTTSHCDVVLPGPAAKEGYRTGESGVADNLQLLGSSAARSSFTLRRHPLSEVEEHRGISQWQPLVDKSADGDTKLRQLHYSAESRVGARSEGVVPGVKDSLFGFGSSWQERRKRKGQRRKERRWERRPWKLWKGWKRRKGWVPQGGPQGEEERKLGVQTPLLRRRSEDERNISLDPKRSGVGPSSLNHEGSGAAAAGGCYGGVEGAGPLIPSQGSVNAGELDPLSAGPPLQSGLSRLGSDSQALSGASVAKVLREAPVSSSAGTSRLSEDTTEGGHGEKDRLSALGHVILQQFLEVLPLRSLSMEGESVSGIFPLPTSRNVLESQCGSLDLDELSWMVALCMGLNSFWGEKIFSEREPSELQSKCLVELSGEVSRMSKVKGDVSSFDWADFFRTRTVDYQGEEVKLAKRFRWQNIAPALPEEIGRVPLEEVCEKGAKYYVENIDLFIKPKDQWGPISYPKVMVEDAHWCEVCEGLVKAGVCVILARDEVFSVGDGLLLNGLFGVSKDEINQGVETYRLIMNLIPFNNISQPVTGDIATLPNWGMMSPYFIQPSEQLLISSEDVRCFFYIMSLPPMWYKYLAFNKIVPDQSLPLHLKGQECYLAAKVLPMGFLNSVSLAQHVHRNMALASGSRASGVGLPERELRKDRSFPVTQDHWRVYLDNFDLLERVEATQVASLQGSVAPSILSLRHQYEVCDVPRNIKKAVARSTRTEMQGAMVDGVAGLAYPRDQKLVKYVCAALKICQSPRVTQRQMQVVCGGLVYVSMFRRSLLGGLNAVWAFIESFVGSGGHWKPMPPECRVEILRFVSLVPLARMNFRLPVDGQITASDASTSGGGVCASCSLTKYGRLVCGGDVRGVHPEDHREHKVLSIGLFDGIAALRVALDLLQVDVMGHIGVEQDPQAARVVEAHFPDVVWVKDVRDVDQGMVDEWRGRFCQASLIIAGAGPPCQGVSGLNADRKGALRDARSSLFTHVKRVSLMVKKSFPWCQVQTLMESVASMDDQDCDIMSGEFGDTPWKCDAGTFTWCSRPRLYWITWTISDEDEGVVFKTGQKHREVELVAQQDLLEVCQEGWIKIDPSKSFPTFTTSRPRTSPGHKPAGIHQCSDREIARWEADSFRFPPYQYMGKHCLINHKDEIRLPSIGEKEIMMGFPLHYTQHCVAKSQRKLASSLDIRHTLIGNSWSVPVVAWFLAQLLAPQGLCVAHTPQDIINKLNPLNVVQLQTRLLRLPLRPWRGEQSPGGEQELAFKLTNLVSIKGEDIMLVSSSQDQVKYQRLRASVPGRLWKWKVVTGWKWKGNKEHINVLEMRAILTSIRWRIEKKCNLGLRFIHLTDSLVCLHSLSRGRSSSRKLRRTICRINALLLVSGCQAFWGYIHTDDNPADAPSRWGRKVKTKFRNA